MKTNTSREVVGAKTDGGLESQGRRGFILTLLAGMGAGVAAAKSPSAGPKLVRIAEFDVLGKRKGVVEVEKIVKSDEEWKKILPPESFYVTRKAGTERAGSGKYAYNHADGTYTCICCGTTLFDSKTKFESGTGWPSFWAPIAKENVKENTDSTFGMSRTEVKCSRCDAHLGHVFDDGPPPTGLRYCMNSVALNFNPRGKSTPST